MSQQLSIFEKLKGIDGIYVAYKANLRCSALVLKDGSVCVFSPVAGLGEKARESLADIGEVKFLLAPNHYHNKGISEYLTAFPGAVLCASAQAAPRLQKITGVVPQELEAIKFLLADGTTLVEPQGLKTGEVWLSVRSKQEQIWLVVDAFSGPKIDKSDSWAERPEILKTFPNYGVKDKVVYANWTRQQLEQDSPAMLVPCHGSIVKAEKLPQALAELLAVYD
ncbi:MAG: hypothetical protein ACRBHB_03580 [Arenicella sp.]